MEKFYKERFEAQRNLIKKTAPLMEVNEIIEKVREELRNLIPNAMEVCILLLDPDADKYTSPLQCALYETPVSCQACKRDRPAVQKATNRKKPVVVSQSEPIRRMDNTLVTVGPEYAIPVLIENRVLSVVSVVIQPFTNYTRKDFFFISDCAQLLKGIIINAKRQWEMTQEKIRISRMLANLKGVKEPVRIYSLLKKYVDNL